MIINGKKWGELSPQQDHAGNRMLKPEKVSGVKLV